MALTFTDHTAQALKHLDEELETIRTGRANPGLVENLPVEAYGTRTPLQQLASITIPEPQVLVIQPWDTSIVKDIEKAILQSTLGIHPVVDSRVIRLPFPPMTEERRKELLKIVHEKAEESRIRIRGHREDAIKALRTKKKDGTLSEDALAAAEKEIQDQVHQANDDIDRRLQVKTDELMNR